MQGQAFASVASGLRGPGFVPRIVPSPGPSQPPLNGRGFPGKKARQRVPSSSSPQLRPDAKTACRPRRTGLASRRPRECQATREADMRQHTHAPGPHRGPKTRNWGPATRGVRRESCRWARQAERLQSGQCLGPGVMPEPRVGGNELEGRLWPGFSRPSRFPSNLH